MDLSWMYWTKPTAAFFVGLVIALSLMTIWDIRSPSTKWKGFLPVAFSRGERFFLSVVIFFAVLLVWVAFLTNVSIVYALPVAALFIFIVVRYG